MLLQDTNAADDVANLYTGVPPLVDELHHCPTRS